MEIKFKNFKPLKLMFDNNDAVAIWKSLFLNDLTNNGLPLYRDPNKYTMEYLNEAYSKLCDKLGWENIQLNNINNTVLSHKNLEEFLANGFENIPEELDEPIHDFHYGLHIQEKKNFSNEWQPRPYIQLEWFNDLYEDLPYSFEHKRNIEFGDLRMINAYVGHIPLIIYSQNDHHNIKQTCRFHDRIKSGLWIEALPSQPIIFDNYIDVYQKWWLTNAPEFVEEHGMDKILHYTGDPVIGRVQNLDVLEDVVNTKQPLVLEEINLG